MTARLLACVVFVLAVGFALPARAQLIGSVQITEFSFSPNGDGKEESTTISYTVLADATVDVLVLGRDSVTVADTLVFGSSSTPGTTYKVVWDGRLFDGSPAPEDTFVVKIHAEGLSESETVFRVVTIDNTAPATVIANLFPFLFGPGSPNTQSSELTIEYDVLDPPPSERVRAIVEILSPSGAVFATIQDELIAVNTRHTAVWSPSLTSQDPDGIYQARVRIEDQAANTASATASVNVDNATPVIKVTNLETGGSFTSVPDTLYGWTFDRNGRGDQMGGADSLFVRFRSPPQGQPLAYFKRVERVYFARDTLFFAVPLLDTLVTDGLYNLGLRAVDILGRSRTLPFAITLDRTTPPAPQLLAPPQRVTRTPVYALDASVSEDTDVMRVFRNGAFLDSIQPNIPNLPALPVDIPLLPGDNRLTATAVDAAGNESDVSNEIVVTFDDAVQLSMPQPFVAGNAFQLNLAEPAASVRLRIFDLAGNLVRVLDHTSASINVTIPWDGRNGDNDGVKKGPLVAMAKVTYANGRSEMFREIFLFQP